MPTTRWVNFRCDEDLHERMKVAAAADGRSLSNWLAYRISRMLILLEVQEERAQQLAETGWIDVPPRTPQDGEQRES